MAQIVILQHHNLLWLMYCATSMIAPVTIRQVAHTPLIVTPLPAILLLLTQTRPMWDEIQDMPGEIFDVPDIETVLVEDENGELGVDLTDINNWSHTKWQQWLCKTTSLTAMNCRQTISTPSWMVWTSRTWWESFMISLTRILTSTLSLSWLKKSKNTIPNCWRSE